MTYFNEIKRRMPHFFDDVRVIEYVSHNKSKSIKSMFTNSFYLVKDPNISNLSEIKDNSFDVAMSINSFQNFPNYIEQLKEMHRVSSKFVMFSCAAPGSLPDKNRYYKNLTEADFYFGIDIESMFYMHIFYPSYEENKLYFWGVKHNNV